MYRKDPRWQSHKAWTIGSLEQCGYTNREHELHAKKWSPADNKKAHNYGYCCSNTQILKEKLQYFEMIFPLVEKQDAVHFSGGGAAGGL